MAALASVRTDLVFAKKQQRTQDMVVCAMDSNRRYVKRGHKTKVLMWIATK